MFLTAHLMVYSYTSKKSTMVIGLRGQCRKYLLLIHMMFKPVSPFRVLKYPFRALSFTMEPLGQTTATCSHL